MMREIKQLSDIQMSNHRLQDTRLVNTHFNIVTPRFLISHFPCKLLHTCRVVTDMSCISDIYIYIPEAFSSSM